MKKLFLSLVMASFISSQASALPILKTDVTTGNVAAPVTQIAADGQGKKANKEARKVKRQQKHEERKANRQQKRQERKANRQEKRQERKANRKNNRQNKQKT